MIFYGSRSDYRRITVMQTQKRPDYCQKYGQRYRLLCGGHSEGLILTGLRLPVPESVRGRCESTVAVSTRPVAAVELWGKQSFNAEVTGTARLYRAASAWISGLDVLPKSM